MITKFKLFEIDKYPTSEKFGNELTEEEFNDLYTKNCKIHKNTTSKLYRGMISKIDYIYQNPIGYIRHSIEPQNIHVTLMSEMESWKNFPPYNQSIIGAGRKKVRGYGTLYEIIPYDNTKIGFCPMGTVWESFGGFSNTDRIKLTNNFLSDWIKYKSGNEHWDSIKNKIMSKNILETFDKMAHLIGVNDFFNMMISYYQTGNFSDCKRLSITEIYDFIKSIDITPIKIINFIEFMFDPKLNKFKSVKYNNNFDKVFNKYCEEHCEGHYDYIQIWCEGPVLLKRIQNI